MERPSERHDSAPPTTAPQPSFSQPVELTPEDLEKVAGGGGGYYECPACGQMMDNCMCNS